VEYSYLCSIGAKQQKNPPSLIYILVSFVLIKLHNFFQGASIPNLFFMNF